MNEFSTFELKYSSLLILISVLLPVYLIRFSVFGIPTTLLEALIWVAALVGASQPRIRKSWIAAAKNLPRPVLYSTLVFLVAACLSTIISPNLTTSLGILKGWIVTPMLYGFLVYASFSHSDFVIRHLPKALILSGLVVALLGLSQVGTLDRIKGPFDVPNSLALFLAPLTVLSFSSFRFRHSSFAGFSSATMFIALLFTQSVAGVISVIIVITGGYFFLWGNPLKSPLSGGSVKKSSPDKGRLGGVLLLAIIVTVISLSPKIHYLLQPNSSAAVRLQLWSVSLDLIKERPLLGIGLGTFETAYQAKLHERFLEYEAARQHGGRSAAEPLREFVFRDPHNWILSFWLNSGLLGLLGFAFLNGYILWQVFRHSPAYRPGRDFDIRISAGLALLALLAFGLTDTIFWKNDLATFHLILLALAVAI